MPSYYTNHYSFGGNKAYFGYMHISPETYSDTVRVPWNVEVHMRYAYMYGVGVRMSGNASGTATGYLSSNPGSTWKKVTGVSGVRNFARGKDAYTASFTVTAYGTTVSGYGSAGGSVAKTVSITIPALAKYTISYNANGGSDAPGSQTKYFRIDLKLSTTVPKRTGYTFKGWTTSSSGSGTVYSAGAKYTGNANTTFYAKWAANTYEISYDVNGGDSITIPKTIKTYDKAVTLTSTVLTKLNYKFLGWSSSATDITTIYSSGSSYNINITAPTTLYAQWKLDSTDVLLYMYDNTDSYAKVPDVSKAVYNVATNFPHSNSLSSNVTFTGYWTRTKPTRIIEYNETPSVIPGANYTYTITTETGISDKVFYAIYKDNTPSSIKFYKSDSAWLNVSDSFSGYQNKILSNQPVKTSSTGNKLVGYFCFTNTDLRHSILKENNKYTYAIKCNDDIITDTAYRVAGDKIYVFFQVTNNVSQQDENTIHLFGDNELIIDGLPLLDSLTKTILSDPISMLVVTEKVLFDFTKNGVSFGNEFDTTGIASDDRNFYFQVHGDIKYDSGNGLKSIIDTIYPIGSIYQSINSTSPSTLFGGTWESFGAGRTLVGVDPSDTDFDASNKTGGAKVHKILKSELPNSKLDILVGTTKMFYENSNARESNGLGTLATTGAEMTTSAMGSGVPHNNMQPYVTVYRWRRTS